MSGMFQKLLPNSEKQKKEIDCEREEVEEGQPHNPFTEILILQHHSDIVRLLLRINDRRFVSAGDDNKAVIWEVQYGRRIAILIGHTHPITSLLLLPPVEENEDSLIISGSFDRQIRMWNAETGECLRVLTEHGASVRYLHLLNQGLFCAGGENLSLWNRKGILLHTIQNCSVEDIHLMISIKYDRIVTAAETELVVYRLHKENGYELSKVTKMDTHQEAIRSLIPVSSSSFASGSVDGMIIIWTTSTLQPIKKLNVNLGEDMDKKTFPFSVQALLCVQEQYLFAAVGCGFYAFDIAREKEGLILQKRCAHLSKTTSIGFACEGEFFVTCSEDRCLRLWGHKPALDSWKDSMAIMERFSGLQPYELSSITPWEPSLLGECCAHGGSIQAFLDFDHEGIVTCGSDGLVIVWKNSEMQKVRRNQLVRSLLLNCDSIV